MQRRFGYCSGRSPTDGLEDRHDVPAVCARTNGAAVYKHRRTVQTRESHDASRHVLVTTTHGHQAVKTLRTGDDFNGIGDDLARHQGIPHAWRAHRNAIRHRNGVELTTLPAGSVSAGSGRSGQTVQMDIAGCDVRPRRGDADGRLGEVGIRVTHGAQHGARRSLGEAIYHEPRVSARVGSGLVDGATARGSLAGHEYPRGRSKNWRGRHPQVAACLLCRLLRCQGAASLSVHTGPGVP